MGSINSLTDSRAVTVTPSFCCQSVTNSGLVADGTFVGVMGGYFHNRYQITGGTFTGVDSFQNYNDGGYISVISGGSFSGDFFWNYGSISGGTFANTNFENFENSSDYYRPIVGGVFTGDGFINKGDINGGTFTGSFTNAASQDWLGRINGGTFTSPSFTIESRSICNGNEIGYISYNASYAPEVTVSYADLLTDANIHGVACKVVNYALAIPPSHGWGGVNRWATPLGRFEPVIKITGIPTASDILGAGLL